MEKFYNWIHAQIRNNKSIEKFVIFLCEFLPYVSAIFYVGILFYVWLKQSYLLYFTIGFPVSVFIFVTILRKIWNRPRPYERLHINPLFKNKKGESTPSRHTASAFAIAFTGFVITPQLGLMLAIIAIIIAISRVISGVHDILDIILAIIIVLVIYWLFLFVFNLTTDPFTNLLIMCCNNFL